MEKTKPKLTRGTAVLIIILAALTLAGAVAARSLPDILPASLADASTPEGRQRYLSSLGWEIDPGSEEKTLLTLPESFDGVMEEYNELQKEQGFDLSRLAGQKCVQYTYRVTNYPGKGTVLAVLYVRGRHVVGGDIHSSSIDGFMHALR